ncbi:hypothetical protein HHI36_002648, partial [Cryptolaemus montrouzieri]
MRQLYYAEILVPVHTDIVQDTPIRARSFLSPREELDRNASITLLYARSMLCRGKLRLPNQFPHSTSPLKYGSWHSLD